MEIMLELTVTSVVGIFDAVLMEYGTVKVMTMIVKLITAQLVSL
jgi:hypothetical protein